MRGLDNTCTLPCDSRKFNSAAKLLVWNAKPNRVPDPIAPSEVRLAPGVAVTKPLVSAPAVARLVPGDNCPTEVRLFGLLRNAAQFTPDWKLSFNCTSTILASRITCRSTDICDCLLYTSDAADDLLCVDLGG